MANTRFQELNNEVMDQIGYKPLSNRIKPVHIANGLFREILRAEHSLKTMNIWSKRFKQGKEIHSATGIKSEFNDIIDDDMTLDEINELRGYVELLLDSDKAVTPELKFSVLTISSKTQVGQEVQNEFKMPTFLYKILNTTIDGQISPAITVIKDLLNDESDEISKFIRPLANSIKFKNLSASSPYTMPLSGIELQIRQGYDRLIQNSIKYTNKLTFLQRIITFSCFSIMYHLSSKILDLSDNYSSTDRIPIVFDANIGDDSLKVASQESLLLARLNIENYYEKVVEGILSSRGGLVTKEDVLSDIEGFSFKASVGKNIKKADVEPHDEMKNLFLGYFNQTHNLLESYARSIRIMMFSRVINSADPALSYTALGGKIGLVYGRTKKRFSPNPNILEIIILSVLEEGEMLTLSEFGERVWKRFGIIIGANPEEDVIRLKKWGISKHVPGDLYSSLALNADAFSEIYISMRYAKRYADGVIIFSLNN